MKKYLLLIGLFAILTFNSAHAQGYYYEDDSDYVEQPRRVRRINYQQPEYREVEYVREESPHYRKISSKDTVREPQSEYRQSGYYNQQQTERIRPYVGLDFGRSTTKFKEKAFSHIMEKDYFQGSAVLGAKFNSNFGAEVFYQQSSTETKNIIYDEKVETDYSAIGIDFIGYMPTSQEFELLASLGMAQYNFHVTDKVENRYVKEWEKDSFNTTGFRFGLGAQFNLSEYVALRGMIRYVKLNDTDIIKNLTEISLGLRWMF